MLNRKLARAIQGLFRNIWQLYRTLTQKLVNWLLRNALIHQRKENVSTAGFVLPTTILLILVVVLTVGALTFRAYNRNSQAIGEAQQRVIYNAATPAIDRARAKLEFLFDPSKDTRYPGGVPSEDLLYSMMLNDGTNVVALSAKDSTGAAIPNVYDLPDEKRVDLNGDGKPDNAWSFRADTNSDGKADASVIYSVIFKSPTPQTGKTLNELLISMKEQDKANQMLIRHGPLSNDLKAIGCGTNTINRGAPEGGWFEDKANTAILRKNFQVDALVIPDNAKSTAVTLEFHQDRQLNRGNKWGAWFRNDLEIYPGPPFNWNGAIHTEGSLIIGESNFTAHLISSPNSCVFEPATNSDITVTNYQEGGVTKYQGVVMAGTAKNNNTDGSATIYIHDANPEGKEKSLNPNTGGIKGGFKPLDISIDPVKILTEDGYQNRTGGNNKDKQDWKKLKDNGLDKRIQNIAQAKPYVDDLYRADNRWGPKSEYDKNAYGEIPTGAKVGQDIPKDANYFRLTAQEPPSSQETGAVGLDGYWERRARSEGLRVLVGERLELGNLNTWFAPKDSNSDNYIDPTAGETEGDPLYPPTVKPYPVKDAREKLTHLDLQRRALRDNLAAVQSTAIYHFAVESNKDYPVACFATTAHPGTPTTLRNSINFVPLQTTNVNLQSNFFTGRGTNGWEFEPPAGDAATFAAAMNNPDSELRKALTNLANFAGDWDSTKNTGGAYPPTQDDKVHPYPALSMWGNFSNLKRAIAKLNSGTTYENLSIADKTYLQTASCTLGMLAYNIDQVQQFDPTNKDNDESLPDGKGLMAVLADQIALLMDGEIAANNLEVLPPGQLATYNYNPAATNANLTKYKESDYYKIPPEAFIGALHRQVDTTSYTPEIKQKIVRMAELVMLKHQIRRDRTFGFSPSPAFGEYITEIHNVKRIFPAACDPDQFTFKSLSGVTEADRAKLARYRLALSRLCGTLNVPASYQPNTSNNRVTTLPKFPSLYYLFPEQDHGLSGNYNADRTGFTADTNNNAIADKDGEYDHRQPLSEPYVADPYIAGLPSADGKAENQKFRVVKSETVSGERDTVPVGTSVPGDTSAQTDLKNYTISRRPDTARTTFPVPDLPVKSIALNPRPRNQWKLPNTTLQNISDAKISGGPNISSNRVITSDGTVVAVPFLDRAFFDGRQYLLTRTLDLDLGMLRNSKAGSDNVWLPQSGIIYGFREDAVREDAIARPANSSSACTSDNASSSPNKKFLCMDLTDPSAPRDPAVTEPHGISTKSIDFRPDPDRRIHGFRLRNGSQIKRKDGLLDVDKNIRGLSFFTDQPIYIQGDFNLHQDGVDDTAGTRLEEFKQLLPTDRPYTAKEFYTDRKDRDDENFAVATVDRWRPSEILADSITILSSNFCDGSIADTFVLPRTTGFPDFTLPTSKADVRSMSVNRKAIYDGNGLFGPGCSAKTGASEGHTSFNNQNRPEEPLAEGQDWVRENSFFLDGQGILPWADFASPIKISRTGQPLIADPQPRLFPPSKANSSNPNNLPVPEAYNADPKRTYIDIDDTNNADDFRLMTPQDIRVNSIIVSGIHPSRENQGYGGLHNFPRFLENWNGEKMFFAGSFLQLNFSNYATSPFETEAWNIGDDAPSKSEIIPYYSPPQRFWGYDVALQLSPAGPAASRFVVPSKNRSEFYNEPPVNDPYINKLCTALKTNSGLVPDPSKVNCPSKS